MNTIHDDSLVDLRMTLEWEKDGIRHQELFFADEANLWRDILPRDLSRRLLYQTVGFTARLEFRPGEAVPDYSPDFVHHYPLSRISLDRGVERSPALRRGRYYPRGIITGEAGIFTDDLTPFRCIGLDGTGVTADFNHPMAGVPFCLDTEVMAVREKTKERGGLCNHWLEMALAGPGIQARSDASPTDFFSDNPFERRDSRPDTLFYAKERRVSHVDDLARKNLAGIYGRILKPGWDILDLMASWQSHLPEGLGLNSVHGLGLNRTELESNPRLWAHTVQDLNQDTRLPFDDHRFHGVICSLSVEYLIDPVAVFKEVARVVKPGGVFAVAFSNRWFPTKTVRLWEDLHEFERLGLVTEYLLATGRFRDLATLSMRGYPRPWDDTYFPGIRTSDPLYVALGTTPVD